MKCDDKSRIDDWKRFCTDMDNDADNISELKKMCEDNKQISSLIINLISSCECNDFVTINGSTPGELIDVGSEYVAHCDEWYVEDGKLIRVSPKTINKILRHYGFRASKKTFNDGINGINMYKIVVTYIGVY